MQKQKKKRKDVWFIKVRGSYLPVNSRGWLTYLPFLVYLVGSLIIALEDTSKIVVAVLITIPNWVAAAIVMTFVASRKS